MDGAGRRPGGSSTAPLFPAIMLESHDTSYKQDKILKLKILIVECFVRKSKCVVRYSIYSLLYILREYDSRSRVIDFRKLRTSR